MKFQEDYFVDQFNSIAERDGLDPFFVASRHASYLLNRINEIEERNQESLKEVFEFIDCGKIASAVLALNEMIHGDR